MALKVHRQLLLATSMTLALVTLVAGLLFAQGTATRSTVTILAEHVTSKGQQGNTRITVFSKAQVIQGDANFSAERIEDRSTADVHEFTCTGSSANRPKFKDTENDIIADKVVAQSSPRQATFTGSVVMVSTPKNKGGAGGGISSSLNSEPTKTTCDTLYYDYNAHTAKATAHVVVTQKTRVLYADAGIYDQNLELITLTGNIRMETLGQPSNTSEFELQEVKNAETVTVSLRDDWIDIVAPQGGLINMTIKVNDAPPATTTPKANEKSEKSGNPAAAVKATP